MVVNQLDEDSDSNYLEAVELFEFLGPLKHWDFDHLLAYYFILLANQVFGCHQAHLFCHHFGCLCLIDHHLEVFLPIRTEC